MKAQEMKSRVGKCPNLKIISLMKSQTVPNFPDRGEMKGERPRPHDGSLSAYSEYSHRADTSNRKRRDGRESPLIAAANLTCSASKHR